MLATAAFVALPLPSGCDVPTGALNSTGVMSKRNELLLRSRATVSLAAQLRDLQEDCAIVDRELESEAAPVLDTCFSSGLFKKGGYKNRAAQHPAWQAGLKAAAGVLMAGVLMVLDGEWVVRGAERFEEGVHGLLGHRGRDRHRWR